MTVQTEGGNSFHKQLHLTTSTTTHVDLLLLRDDAVLVRVEEEAAGEGVLPQQHHRAAPCHQQTVLSASEGWLHLHHYPGRRTINTRRELHRAEAWNDSPVEGEPVEGAGERSAEGFRRHVPALRSLAQLLLLPEPPVHLAERLSAAVEVLQSLSCRGHAS